MELSAALDRAREIMTLGGSRERAFTCRRPPFGALVLSHRDEPPRELPDGSIALAGGYGASCDERAEFLRGCRAALAASGGGPRPPRRGGPPPPAPPPPPPRRPRHGPLAPRARP